MENVSGEDLSYFWRGWFLTNDKLDQGVTDIKYVDNDPAKGANITVVNNEQMVLPVPMLIEQENGKKDSITLPVEIWHRGGSWTFHYPSTSTITKITIDPDHDYPDIDPSNNILAGKLVPKGTTANDVINKYLTAIGGADKINNIKDLYYIASGSIQGQNIQFTRKYIVPGKMLLIISFPGLNRTAQKLVVNADSVLLTAQGQTIPLNDEDQERYREQAYPFPEINFTKNGYDLQLSPTLDNVDGKDAYVITVTSPSGTVSKKYYDAETGLKLKDELSKEQGNSAFSYSNYKEVSGIMIPFTITVSQQVDFSLNITDVKINSGLKDEDLK
jgi:hypothetical protein